MTNHFTVPLNTSARIQRSLSGYAPTGAAVDPTLRDALADSLRPTGKHYRAGLVLAGCSALGLEDSRADQLASSVEYFHTASLLLDDLPCMDDAMLRRGCPCVHTRHGEPATILAALSLISRAYLLAEMAFSDLPGHVRLRAHMLIERRLGASGLTGGQAADLHHNPMDKCARQSGRIALLKTGGLFQLCLLLPSMAAGVRADAESLLKRLAVYWSLAYQISDDIRDLEGSPAQDGKTTGRDRTLDRANLVLTAGHDTARKRLTRLAVLSEKVISKLAEEDVRWGYLGQFHRVLFEPAADKAAA